MPIEFTYAVYRRLQPKHPPKPPRNPFTRPNKR